MKKTLVLLLVFIFAVLCACSVEKEPEDDGRWKIPINTRDPSDFTAAGDFIRYPQAVQAVDVASHQEQIDWEQVRNAGVDVALLQLGYRGYSEGKVYLDPFFLQNLDGAASAGLKIGVYFFSQALSVEEAREEAEFVLQSLNHARLDYPVFFDWEEVPEGRTGGRATTAITDYALAFCETITEHGYQAGVYFNQAYGYSLFNLEKIRPYSFWLAEYAPYLSFYYDVDIWQYTSSGHVDGIETRADMNLIFASAEAPTEVEQP